MSEMLGFLKIALEQAKERPCRAYIERRTQPAVRRRHAQSVANATGQLVYARLPSEVYFPLEGGGEGG